MSTLTLTTVSSTQETIIDGIKVQFITNHRGTTVLRAPVDRFVPPCTEAVTIDADRKLGWTHLFNNDLDRHYFASVGDAVQFVTQSMVLGLNADTLSP